MDFSLKSRCHDAIAKSVHVDGNQDRIGKIYQNRSNFRIVSLKNLKLHGRLRKRPGRIRPLKESILEPKSPMLRQRESKLVASLQPPQKR